MLGTYRKSHIPDGPGYTEKYYFNGGDTGFRVWRDRATPPSASASAGTSGSPSRRGRWRCSAPRCCCYPTAIGSEPPDPTWDSSGHWQRVMQGHAGANLMPLVAANRVGHEVGATTEITFYGSSFIADATGAKVAEADRDERGGDHAPRSTSTSCAPQRHAWGLFRDRRPDLYGPLLTLDGTTPVAMTVHGDAGGCRPRSARHERTVMCWPARASLYGERMAEARAGPRRGRAPRSPASSR